MSRIYLLLYDHYGDDQMPSVVEANGQVFWGQDVECPECGAIYESFTGIIEMCDDCLEADDYYDGTQVSPTAFRGG